MGDKFVWPSLREVQQYRRDVRDVILNLINTQPMEAPVTQDSPWVSLKDVVNNGYCFRKI